MQSGGRASRCMHPAWRSHGPMLGCWHHGSWINATVRQAKAPFCRPLRRASGGLQAHHAPQPVFYGPFTCTVRPLGSRGRKQRSDEAEL